MKHEILFSFTGLLIRCLFIFSIVASLAGCASITERTDKMLEEGRSDDALKFIENERSRDPKDADLLGVERRVRLQWLSDKLIEVRLTRLSGNVGPAAELMRLILSNEAKWAIIPSGAVYSTQAEEVMHLSKFVQAGIYEALKKRQPLAAKSRFQQDRALLEDVLKMNTASVKADIAKAGREFCDTEKKHIKRDDFFSAVFLKKSCATFATQITLPATKSSVQFYGSISPDVSVDGAPLERVSDFARDLKTEFEKSIWYESSAKRTLTLKLNGPLTEKIEERDVWRSKPYTVRVPYEEKSVRKKEAQTGLMMTAHVLMWLFSTWTPDREIDNGDGTMTVYETKYRDEVRDYGYQAKEITQTLDVDWKIRVGQDSHAHQFDFKERNRIVSDEHSVSFPSANLYPEVRKLVRPTEWLQTLNRKLMDRIGHGFHQAWINQFCVTVSATDSAELQHRCLYGANGSAPSFNSDWFSGKYGLEIGHWREITTVRPVLQSAAL